VCGATCKFVCGDLIGVAIDADPSLEMEVSELLFKDGEVSWLGGYN